MTFGVYQTHPLGSCLFLLDREQISKVLCLNQCCVYLADIMNRFSGKLETLMNDQWTAVATVVSMRVGQEMGIIMGCGEHH